MEDSLVIPGLRVAVYAGDHCFGTGEVIKKVSVEGFMDTHDGQPHPPLWIIDMDEKFPWGGDQSMVPASFLRKEESK